MAKWAKDKQNLSEATQPTEEKLRESQDGGPGNQVDARLELMNQLADSADEVRKDAFEDVTTESYDDAPGTSEVAATADRESDEASAEAEEDTQEHAEESAKPKKYKIKVNGVEQEVSEEELIARAQKVSAADQYLAESAKLYAEAAKHTASPSKKDDSAKVEEDDLALARAIQMGSEEEAVEAIKSLKGSQRLSTDDVAKIIDSRFDQRMSFQRDLNKFQDEYKDLLADENAKTLIFELDNAYHLQGEAPNYDRFKKAAEAVKKTVKVTAVASMDDKAQRKASVKVVTGGGARQPARAEEKEPTPSEIIANMAQKRGQFVAMAGN